jgi:hypothetical protein
VYKNVNEKALIKDEIKSKPRMHVDHFQYSSKGVDLKWEGVAMDFNLSI